MTDAALVERLRPFLRHTQRCAYERFMQSDNTCRCGLEGIVAHIESLTTDLTRIRDALTPSAETKAAYIGEFHFFIEEQSDDAMCPVTRKIAVPWTTVKEIMAAIRNRALSETANGK